MELVQTAELNGQKITMRVTIEDQPEKRQSVRREFHEQPVFDKRASAEPRDEAIGRIQLVMRRETQRFAEIANVDVMDQFIERLDADRISKLPKERPVTILQAGTKNEEAVQKLWRKASGDIVEDHEARRRFEREQDAQTSGDEEKPGPRRKK